MYRQTMIHTRYSECLRVTAVNDIFSIHSVHSSTCVVSSMNQCEWVYRELSGDHSISVESTVGWSSVDGPCHWIETELSLTL